MGNLPRPNTPEYFVVLKSVLLFFVILLVLGLSIILREYFVENTFHESNFEKIVIVLFSFCIISLGGLVTLP
jgi:hypothetical protein